MQYYEILNKPISRKIVGRFGFDFHTRRAVLIVTSHESIVRLREYRLPPLGRYGLRSSGLLRSVCWLMFIDKFYAHHSVHRESILKNFQQDDTLVQYFIISCKSLYMFRVKHSVRSSDSSTTTAGHILFVNTRCCKYSLIELLMMDECFNRTR
jgi:hypothetical protein